MLKSVQGALQARARLKLRALLNLSETCVQLQRAAFCDSAQSKAQHHRQSHANRASNAVDNTVNISDNIMKLRQRKLHLQANNPICIVKNEIVQHFRHEYDNLFVSHDSLSEVVSTQQNFEDLLIPSDHSSRDLTDTYYFDEHTLLRPQTSVTCSIYTIE